MGVVGDGHRRHGHRSPAAALFAFRRLAAVQLLTLWKYTNMSDPRWTWGNQYILLRQETTPTVKQQKVGVLAPDGWVGYARAGNLFVKKFQHLADARYPDFGSSVEVFTNHEMLEVETLGPLASLAPGGHVEHTEQWFLFRNV